MLRNHRSSWAQPLALWVVSLGVLLLLGGCRGAVPPGPDSGDLSAERSQDAERRAEEAIRELEPTPLSAFKTLLESPVPEDRTQALDRFAQVAEHDEATVLVLELLKHEEDYNVRASAVSAVGGAIEEGWGPDPLPTLAQLAKDESSHVRRGVATALGRVSDAGAEPILLELRRDPTADVRNEASDALMGHLQRRGDVGWHRLAAFLGRRDGDLSALAALKLHQAGRQVIPALIEALTKAQDWQAREAIVEVLAAVAAGKTEASRAFARRSRATTALQEKEDPPDLRALGPLLGALRDPHPRVREAAAGGLGLLGNKRAVEPLGEALSDPSANVRRRAASALMLLPAAAVLPQLAEAAAADRDPAVRQFAVEAIGWIGGQAGAQPKTIVPLAAALSDAEPDVRRAAAVYLGQIGRPEALEPLARMFAVGQLAPAGEDWGMAVIMRPDASREQVEAVAQRLRDVGWTVSEATVSGQTVVGVHGPSDPDRRALLSGFAGSPGVQAISPDPDADVRWAAVRAAAQLRVPAAYDMLIEAYNRPGEEPQVVQAADRGLSRIGREAPLPPEAGKILGEPTS